MKKRGINLIICLLLIAYSLLLFTGCQSPQQKDALAIMKNYLEAWKTGNSEKMYDFISAPNQEMVSREDYVKDFNDFPLKPNGYRIRDSRIRGIRAEVKVFLTFPDLTDIEGERKNKEEQVFILVNEDGKWKVFE
jgi:hypothetical protein